MADTPDATGRGCLTGPLETVAEASARYVIRGTVTQGGYGLIRVAFDTVLQEVVALKTVHRHYSFGNSNLTKEAQIGRQVKSHFVVRIYDLVVINGELCLVMEYINGKTLLQLYKNARP